MDNFNPEEDTLQVSDLFHMIFITISNCETSLLAACFLLQSYLQKKQKLSERTVSATVGGLCLDTCYFNECWHVAVIRSGFWLSFTFLTVEIFG